MEETSISFEEKKKESRRGGEDDWEGKRAPGKRGPG